MSGVVESLTTDWRGDTLAAAVGSSDTVLTVGDTADFDEDDTTTRWLVIADSLPLEYIAVDDDASTVTLADVAGAVFEAGDPVTIWDPSVPPSGAKVVEYVASVMTDRGPVDAVVEHEAIPFAGVDTLVGASVTLTEDAYGNPYVDKILGRQPSLDLTNADASTLDTSTMPPVPGGQTFSVDAPVATAGFPEDHGWWQVVDGEVVGFWRLIAGVWTTQDIVTAEALVAKNAIIDALTGKTITGTTVQTRDAQDRGIKLGRVEGSTNYDEAFIVFNESGVPFIKAVPAEALAVIAGEIKANSITVAPTSTEEGTSLGGVTEVTRHPDGSAGVLRLTGYTTAPKSAPTVTTGYDTVQFINDGQWGNRHGWTTDGTYWYTTRIAGTSVFLEKWTTAGVFVASVVCGVGTFIGSGVVYLGTTLHPMMQQATSATIAQFNTSLGNTGAGSLWVDDDGASLAALGADAATGDLLIAQSRPSDLTIPNRVRIRRYAFVAGGTLTGGASVDTNFAYAGDLAGVTYGTHDLGGNRYVITKNGSQNLLVTGSTGSALTAEDFESGMTAKVGFTYTGGAFVSMDATGKMRTYTGQDKATAIGHANLTKYVSNTLASATLETTQSPRAKIVIPKRTKLNVTTSAINTGGTNAPDRVKIYVGQNTATPAADPANTNMILQADPSVGVITKSYSAIATTPDTNPPTINGFAAAAGTVQQIQLADESVLVDGVGGPAWTAYTPTFTASTTNPTLGNFTISGRYALLPRNTVAFVALFTCNTAAGLGTGNYQFGLPVAARATNEVVCIAQQSGPNHGYQGRGASTTTINLFLTSTDAVATVTSTGMAAATSIRITGTYERA